jgi:hypothetical protein
MTRDEMMAQIVTLVRVKEAIASVDTEHLWPYRLPRVAVNERQLADLERALGEELDPGYRTFLSLAAGWPNFHQACDLFGPDELLGAGLGARASELQSYLEPIALEQSKIVHDEVRPICCSAHDIDLFVIGRPGSTLPGTVIWFAGAEIERFPSFDEFFLSMIDYNRLTYQELSRIN